MTWEKPNMQHGKLTQWNWIPLYPEGIHLGENIDIGAFCLLDGKNELYIGDNVMIGSHCSIYTHSTIDKKIGAVVIEEGAKIGSHCTIMPDITIGKNALVAAHSFVNKDVPENQVWGGVPVTKIRNPNENMIYNYHFQDGAKRNEPSGTTY